MAVEGEVIGLILLIIGILLVLAELASPGSFLVIPATVLIIIGIMGILAPELLVSWATPIVLLAVVPPVTYITIKMYQRLAPPAPPETVVATSLVGTHGIVEVVVEPNNLKGKVRIDHDTWSATADTKIPVGSKVIVKASEGVHVKVEEIK